MGDDGVFTVIDIVRVLLIVSVVVLVPGQAISIFTGGD
jgi:competence protein ComGC